MAKIHNVSQAGFTHRLVSRRMRETMNSALRTLPAVRARHKYNPAYLHPSDLAALGVDEGALIEISSEHGAIIGVAATDANLRPGVLSMTHGWGRMPDEEQVAPDAEGVSVATLVSSTADREPINAMPRFSAIPVRLRAIAGAAET